MKIDKNIYSPDSSKVIVRYYYDNGALGKSSDQVSILNRGEKIPEEGNFISESPQYKIQWISNDSILVDTRVIHKKSELDEIKKWAKPSFRNITLIYKNLNPPYRLHKEIFFSNYEINGDSITFFTGVEHFIKYLDWNEEYKYHRKHLDIVDKVSEDILISIPDDILVVEKKEIVQGRFIDNKYYPKYEFIPSMLSEVKKDKLLKLF